MYDKTNYTSYQNISISLKGVYPAAHDLAQTYFFTVIKNSVAFLVSIQVRKLQTHMAAGFIVIYCVRLRLIF